jgi:predicted lactoylglutathione lyase
MATKIFVNLPVKDLDKSVGFFTKLGFSVNKQFTDETAACIVISDDIYAMLLTHAKFKQFTKKEIVDSNKNTEVILALSAESKEKVSEIVKKAVDAGGKESADPNDYGFMYQRSFQDLDGHLWEVLWMNPAHIQPA